MNFLLAIARALVYLVGGVLTLMGVVGYATGDRVFGGVVAGVGLAIVLAGALLLGPRARRASGGFSAVMPAPAEEYWDTLADDRAAILAAYRRGDKVLVDVLAVEECELVEGKRKVTLKLRLVAPRKRSEAGAGEVLEWDPDKAFAISAEHLLWHEVLERGFDGYFFVDTDKRRIRWYQQQVKRGLGYAKKNKLGG